MTSAGGTHDEVMQKCSVVAGSLFMVGVNNAKHPFRREDSRATRRLRQDVWELKLGVRN